MYVSKRSKGVFIPSRESKDVADTEACPRCLPPPPYKAGFWRKRQIPCSTSRSQPRCWLVHPGDPKKHQTAPTMFADPK